MFSVRRAAVCCVLLLVPANLFALQAFLDNGGYMNDTATGWAPLPGQQQGQRRAGFAGEWLWCSGGPGGGTSSAFVAEWYAFHTYNLVMQGFLLMQGMSTVLSSQSGSRGSAGQASQVRGCCG